MPTVQSNLHVGDPVTFEVILDSGFKHRETLEILVREEGRSLCWGSSHLGSLMETQRCKHLIPLDSNRTLLHHRKNEGMYRRIRPWPL